MPRFAIFFLLTLIIVTTTEASEKNRQAEVIHWWISGSEAAALKTISSAFEAEGYTWIDTPVKTSFHAKSAALSRILDGNPPVMMQWHAGISLVKLHSEGILRDIKELADDENWQHKIPESLWKYLSINGRMVAVPLTLHGANWLWGNNKILKQLEITAPQSWKQFLQIAPLIQKSGFIPLALGGQAWQERVLFLTILLDIGGPEFYKATIVNHEQDALSGPVMAEVFSVFSSLKQFTDEQSPGRSWNDTAKLIIDGRAAFMVMGDWAKGEFLQAGLIADLDFSCSLAPGSKDSYILVSDVFAMARVDNKDQQELQTNLARIIMSRNIQRDFSLIKGSIPPRIDIDPAPFDICAQKAMAIVSQPNSTLPGFNMSNTGLTASAFMNEIDNFWKKGGDPVSAAQSLAGAVAASKLQ